IRTLWLEQSDIVASFLTDHRPTDTESVSAPLDAWPLHYLSCGIGKTTLIKTVSKLLIDKKVSIAGFYTEEIRNAGKRIGFDVVTLDGKRGILARVMEHVDQSNISRYQVGQYNVNKDSFESLALPIFSAQECRVLVLDEIGRMELFSDDFKQSVKSALNNPLQVILATIPVAKGRPISFVEEIRQHPNAKVFTHRADLFYLYPEAVRCTCGFTAEREGLARTARKSAHLI
ncbi:unnamed protein product, partial [Timema podura]|nr:unnamed protein product [Timema podura]